MAVAFKGGVIVGADSRTTTGSYIANRVTDKLTKVHDLIYCCRSGSAADTQAVADIVQYYLQMYRYERNKQQSSVYRVNIVYANISFLDFFTSVQQDEPPTVNVAATLFQELCYQNKDQLSAGIIVAGWDKKKGGTVYNIPLGGALIQQPFAIGGSGSTYIYGYCDSQYKDDMSREECIDFVKNCKCWSPRQTTCNIVGKLTFKLLV
jgi:20S proteasome subunit beta 1